MTHPKHAWYLRKFRGCAFANEYGEWRLADLLWHFRKLPVSRISIRRLMHSLGSIDTDEGVGSDAFIGRAFQTDGRWPILVLRKTDGRLHIMDGTHRLWKAKYFGRKRISGRIVPVKDLLKIRQAPGTYEST